MATINPIRLFGTISRFEGGEGDAPVIVYGPCYKNAAPGDGFDLPFEVIKRMAPGYEAFSNVREMHQPKAIGTSTIEINEANKEILMRAEIVDKDAKEKVLSGVYKGFSVGVKPTKVKRGAGVTTVIDGIWYETSLVDRPADPGSVFSISRIEGEECEVEEVEGDDSIFRGAFNDEVTKYEPSRMMRFALETLESVIWNIRYSDATDKDAKVREAAREFGIYLAPIVSRMERDDDLTLARSFAALEASSETIARLETEAAERLVEVETVKGRTAELESDLAAKDAELLARAAQIEELEKQPDPAQSKPMMVTQEELLKRIAENLKAEPTGAEEVQALLERSKTATTEEERAEIMRDLTALRAKGVSV